MAVAESNLGQRVSCSTTGLACNISGLACGQTHEVYVVGVDETCDGARSNVTIVQTGERSNPLAGCHCIDLVWAWDEIHIIRFLSSALSSWQLSSCYYLLTD